MTSIDDETGWRKELYERDATLTPKGARLDRTALRPEDSDYGRSPERRLGHAPSYGLGMKKGKNA